MIERTSCTRFASLPVGVWGASTGWTSSRDSSLLDPAALRQGNCAFLIRRRFSVCYSPRTARTGVLYSDGTTDVTLQDRLMEYGSTMDPVCKLCASLSSSSSCCSAGIDQGIKRSSRRALLLLQVDQAGVLHAPHAQGRSYLHEFGFDDVVVPVHGRDGRLVLSSVAALAPNTPVLVRVVSWLQRFSGGGRVFVCACV